MWDYVLFFGYNLIALIVALIVWRFIPKPKPYDYTTIPGLKIDKPPKKLPKLALPPGKLISDISKEVGNIPEIVKFKSFAHFHKSLHEDYGPLVCFYWGPRYVVSISDWQLVEQLPENNRILLPFSATFEVLKGDARFWKSKSEDQTIIANTEIVVINEKMRERLLTGDIENALLDFSWQTAVEQPLKAVTSFQTFVSENYDKCQLDCLQKGPFVSTSDEKLIGAVLTRLISHHVVSVKNLCNFFHKVFLAKLLYRVLNEIYEIKASETTEEFDCLDTNFENPNYRMVLEVLQKEMLKFPFVIAYVKEIDLNGHPVPGFIPILLCSEKFTEIKPCDLSDWKQCEILEKRIESIFGKTSLMKISKAAMIFCRILQE